MSGSGPGASFLHVAFYLPADWFALVHMVVSGVQVQQERAKPFSTQVFSRSQHGSCWLLFTLTFEDAETDWAWAGRSCHWKGLESGYSQTASDLIPYSSVLCKKSISTFLSLKELKNSMMHLNPPSFYFIFLCFLYSNWTSFWTGSPNH